MRCESRDPGSSPQWRNSPSDERASLSLRHKAFAAVRWTTLATVVRATMQIVQVAALARLLAPAEFGMMAIVTVAVAFAQALGDLGMSTALIQRETVTAQQRTSAFWMSLFISALLALLLTAAAPVVSVLYGNTHLMPLIAISAATLVIQASTQQILAFAEKALRFRQIAIIEICAGACGFAAALMAALEGWGVYALVVGPLTLACVSALLSWPFLSGDWRPTRHFRFSDVYSFVRFGSAAVVTNLLGQLNTALDILIGGRVLSAQVLGVFTVPRNLALQLQFMINPIVTRVGFPLIAQVQGDRARVRSIYLSTLNMTASANAPLYLGLAFFAPEVTLLLLGKGWEASGMLLRVLAAWGGARSLVNPVGSLLMGMGRVDLLFKWNVVHVVVSAVALLIGSQYGAIGLAYALLVVVLVSVFAAWYLLVRPTCDAGFGEYALIAFRPFVLAFCAIGFAHTLAYLTSGSLVRLVWGVVLSVPLYLILSALLNRDWVSAMRDLTGLAKPRAI
jgi:lipopolysaccharide exporter